MKVTFSSVSAVVLVFGLASADLGAVSPDTVDREIPLKNWQAPPAWGGFPARAPVHHRDMTAADIEVQPLALPSPPAQLVAIAPCRIIDTRPGYSAAFAPGLPLLGGVVTPFDLNSAPAPCNGIPATAVAYSLNVTVVAPPGAGYLSAFPGPTAPSPLTSLLNFAAGQIIANASVVPGDSNGVVGFFVSTTLDLVVDVNGYYAPGGVVNSLNVLEGVVTLAQGTNVTITTDIPTKTVTIAASGSGGGSGLPPGSSGQTLRYGTSAWEASSLLVNDGSALTITGPVTVTYPTVAAFHAISTSGYGVAGESGSANGVWGNSTTADGVLGTAVSSTKAGVKGTNSNSGGYGVWGNSAAGIGVYGSSGGSSAGVSGNNTFNGPGVYATSAGGHGVVAYATTGAGVSAVSTSSSGVLASSTSGAGVSGTSSSGNGVSGTSTSSDGVLGTASAAAKGGVKGVNTSATGFGVWGEAATGTGVYGSAAGTNAGVSGINAASGPGVYGSSVSGTGVTASSSTSVGVWGTSTSSDGILGAASASAKAGVKGTTTNAGGYGVFGSATTGAGVYGSASGSNAGVMGINSAGGPGVSGVSSSGTGVFATSSTGNAVVALASTGTGVSATSTSGAGVSGTSTSESGVVGNASAVDRAGVKGSNPSHGGYGVWGVSETGWGVYGVTNGGEGDGVWGENLMSGNGVRGTSDNGNGVRGDSYGAGHGVFATTISGHGVYGIANAATKAGVHGKNDIAGGYGVWGSADVGYGVYGTTTSGYAVYCAGNGGYTGSWGNLSDARLKKDVEPLGGALARVLSLRGVTFNWRVEEAPDKKLSREPQIGVIAQEVEAILPEIVVTGPDGYKAVDYAKLTPVLVEAVKEQQGLIRAQEARLDGQQREIQELRQMVRSMLEERAVRRAE